MIVAGLLSMFLTCSLVLPGSMWARATYDTPEGRRAFRQLIRRGGAK